MNMKNKVVLITGAAVGIGRACAIKFAESGARVILIDVDSDKLDSLKNELSRFGVIAYACDISSEQAVNDIISDIEKEIGTVDVLINNAALWRHYALFNEVSSDIWKKYIDVNLLGTVYCTKAVLPGMIKNKYGRIINVSSVAGVYGNANMVCYSATKGAVIALTRALAKEVADKGITVNAVSPGSVSPSSNPDINYTEPSNLAFMGRTGSDLENANLIYFLAGDEASYISAQNIQIDGCRKKQ